MTTALSDVEDLVFQETRDRLEAVIVFLKGSKAAALTASELEWALQDEGRELVRCLLQGQLVLRSRAEERLAAVHDAEGMARSRAESGHVRALATIFGEVEVSRIAYRSPGLANLHPADAALNLPEEHTPTGYVAWRHRPHVPRVHARHGDQVPRGAAEGAREPGQGVPGPGAEADRDAAAGQAARGRLATLGGRRRLGRSPEILGQDC